MQASKEQKFDVALSYASEDRDFVDKVANYLRERQVRVFYDQFEKVNLWAKELKDELGQIFRTRSQYVVIFISRHYAQKAWTNHERKSALSRASEEKREYVLPAYFDDTELPGLRSTIAGIDLRNETPESFGAMILSKVTGREFPVIACSNRLQQDIERLHISNEIRQSIYTVLTHPKYPQWMAISGNLVQNPVWETISSRTRQQMIKNYRINGPGAPQIMHLDMMLMRCNDDQGHGRIYTYFSPDWGTNLITFRRWLPEDNPDHRQEENAAELAKYLHVPAASILVTPVNGKYAVSVKPHARHRDLIIYIYEFCSVVFTENPSSFACGQPKTHARNGNEDPWFYLQTLRNDNKSYSVNGDVIRALHELFSVTLGSLPTSLADGFSQKGVD